MNFLAKHFFDYQSFVNLPHKAVQLHKTPPSQAGVDPSAAWAPKSMQIAGKNHPAPGARANRNSVDARPGSHRHGRPSKLQFRNWGEPHGELREEKIIPHKDPWMSALDGDFKHLYEERNIHEDTEATEFTHRHVPPQHLEYEEMNAEVLVILTLGSMDFLTATVKTLKGMSTARQAFVKTQLFVGNKMVEERHSRRGRRSSHQYRLRRRSTPVVVQNHVAPVRNHVAAQPRLEEMRENSGISSRNDSVIATVAELVEAVEIHKNPSTDRLSSLGNPTAEAVDDRETSLNMSTKKVSVSATSNNSPTPSMDLQQLQPESSECADENNDPLKSEQPQEIQNVEKCIAATDSERRRSAMVTSTFEANAKTDLSESFLLRLPYNCIHLARIVIQIYTHNDYGEEVPVGSCYIGANSPSRGIYHWQQMAMKHGTPVCMWHKIFHQK